MVLGNSQMWNFPTGSLESLLVHLNTLLIHLP
uniref:Uncharacterized protein n=1 Tax=Anguilla anguilla TaxID=7936 RepID=A0A0E9TDT3_ANGAN